MPEPDKYRGKCSQPIVRLSVLVPDGGIGEGTEGYEGVFSSMWGANVSTGQTPTPSWSSRGLNQTVHMEGPMALATYVSEDGLVEHQWPTSVALRVFDAPV